MQLQANSVVGFNILGRALNPLFFFVHRCPLILEYFVRTGNPPLTSQPPIPQSPKGVGGSRRNCSVGR